MQGYDSRMHLGSVLGLLLIAVGVLGCVSQRNILPRRATAHEDSSDAVGFVTVSTPLFTPMDAAVTDIEDRLDFGELKDEMKIKEALETPAFGSQEFTVDIFRMAMAARLAGVAVDIQESSGDGAAAPAEGDDAEDTAEDGDEDAEGDTPATTGKNSRSRSFTTPKAIDPETLTLPGIDFSKAKNSEGHDLGTILLDMITPRGNPEDRFNLPLDEVATMIASLKTYMVHLEEYYNVEGYNYARGLENSYVPYRMHFTVTAEPGWFSRYRQNDAVCEVTARIRRGPKGPHGEQDLIFLSASPTEVGQTVTEFHAAMSHLALSLQASAPISDFAQLGANMERVQSAARRLEGIRTHKTMTIGFPDSNRLRIRFLAQRAATEPGRDLQPVSRLVTAIVLVPKEGVSLRDLDLGVVAKRDARALADNAAYADRQYELEKTTRGALRDIGHRLDRGLVSHLESCTEECKALQSHVHRHRIFDGVTESTVRTAATFVRQGFGLVGGGTKEFVLDDCDYMRAEEILDQTFLAVAEAFQVFEFDEQWVRSVRNQLGEAAQQEGAPARRLSSAEWHTYLRRIVRRDLASQGSLVVLASRVDNVVAEVEALRSTITSAVGSVRARALNPRAMAVGGDRGEHADDEMVRELLWHEAVHPLVLGGKGLEDYIRGREQRAKRGRWAVSVEEVEQLDSFLDWVVRQHPETRQQVREIKAQMLELNLKDPRERFLTATLVVFDAAYDSLRSLRMLSQVIPADVEDKFRDMQSEVEHFLAGTACDIETYSFFSPTVYDERGRWNPPRDFLVAVDPIANRLRAEGTACTRMSPIPPWMGPLGQRASVSDAAGYYTLDRSRPSPGDEKYQQKQRELAVLRVALDIERDPARHPELPAYYAAREAHAHAVENLQVEGTVARTNMATLAKDIADLTRRIKPLAPKTPERVALEAVRTKRQQEHDAQALALENLVTEERESGARARARRARVTAQLARIDRVQAQLDMTQLQVLALTPLGALRPLLGRGEASVQFKYVVPPMLLDERRKLIQHPQAFARVLGLRRTAAVSAGADACPPRAGTGTDNCCAPGEFCRLAPGANEAVLHVRDIDLTAACEAGVDATLADGKKIVAYLELLVIPDGMSPEEGLTYPAAQITSVRVELMPRVQASGVQSPLTSLEVSTLRAREGERVAGEQRRVDAEIKRGSAEALRKTQESTRDTSEAKRVAQEAVRQKQEGTRELTEAERKKAETKRAADYPPKP